LHAYLALWIGVAAVSAGAVAAELAWRYRASDSALARQGILHAVELFLPCVLTGGLMTLALVRFAPDSAALLPGLWALFFSLGIFASCRRLPPPCLWIGGYYVVAGVLAIAFSGAGHALSP